MIRRPEKTSPANGRRRPALLTEAVSGEEVFTLVDRDELGLPKHDTLSRCDLMSDGEEAPLLLTPDLSVDPCSHRESQCAVILPALALNRDVLSFVAECAQVAPVAGSRPSFVPDPCVHHYSLRYMRYHIDER